MSRLPLLLEASFLLFILYASCFTFPVWAKEKPKSVVVVLADGMGIGMINFKLNYDRYVRKKEGALRNFLMNGQMALIQTASSDSLVPDSASGATAQFCGIKTKRNFCGLDKDGKACETVAERAKKKGKRIAVVTTDEILEATPAALLAHGQRKDWATLRRGVLNLRPDLLIGGGRKNFPEDLFKNAGFSVFLDTTSLARAKEENWPLALLLHEEALPFPSQDKSVPHLKDLAQVALKILINKSFFLLVENEWTDSAGHANDAQLVLEAMDELEGALEALMPLAKEGKISLYVTSDHDTGGLAMAAPVSKFSLPEIKDLVGFKKVFWISNYHTDLPVVFALWPKTTGPWSALLDSTEVHGFLVEALDPDSEVGREGPRRKRP